MSKTYENLTEKQRNAVLIDDKNALISASAGSGKTFVVIERITRLIIEKKADLSQILAVTFTKLAANEMKEKLKTSLLQEINNGREDLKDAYDDVFDADISTIHAFCSKLLKKYFYLADIDYSFEVMEESKKKKLLAEAIDVTLNDYYEKGDNNFLKVVSYLSTHRNDNTLREILTSIVIYLESQLNQDIFDVSILTHKNAPTLIHDYFLSKVQNAGVYFTNAFMPFVDIFKGNKSKSTLVNNLITMSLQLENCDDLYSLIEKLDISFSIPKKSEEFSDYIDDFSYYATAFKDYIKFLSDIFSTSRQDTIKMLQDNIVIIEVLQKLTSDITLLYSNLKREENLLDFADLEKYTYTLLQNEEVLQTIKNQYKYIFIDEYQDVNAVQEAIITKLSNDNEFMVGDSKQSIYAFRGCNPEFFISKYKTFAQNDNDNIALPLDYNFRCAPNIIKGVNNVFSRVFTENFGGFNYKDSPMLYKGLYQGYEGSCTLHIYNKPTKEKTTPNGIYSVIEDYELEKVKEYSCQEKLVANLITDALNSTYYDIKESDEKNRVKKIKLKDICILYRYSNSKLIRTLTNLGIPVTCETKINIIEYPEIKVMVELVKALNGLNNDISLTTVMSKIYNFSLDELAFIRKSEGRKLSFYECVLNFSQKDGDLNKKVDNFLQEFSNVRLLAEYKTAEEILYKIINESGYLYRLYASNFGEHKVKRVKRFISEASKNKKMSIKQFSFYLIDSLKDINSSQTDGEDAVNIMTIHASKGLEFPYVILFNNSAKFDERDIRGKIIKNKEYGISTKHYDEEKMMETDTPLTHFFKHIYRYNTAIEEARILYVAMTRAKYKLDIICEKDKLGNIKNDFSIRLPKSLSEFICLSDMDYIIYDDIELKNIETSTIVAGKTEEDNLSNIITKNFQYNYPYEASTTIPLKQSVSDINESNDEYYEVTSLFGQSNSELGTCYHNFLQLIDFYSYKKGEKEKFLKNNLMTLEQLQLIDEDKIESILKMPIFETIKDYKLFKEEKFCYFAKSDLLGYNLKNENVLIQGIIDLLAIKNDTCILIDYKLSTIKKDEDLIAHYKTQLTLYKDAIEKCLNLKVTNVYLVNILQEKCIEIL